MIILEAEAAPDEIVDLQRTGTRLYGRSKELVNTVGANDILFHVWNSQSNWKLHGTISNEGQVLIEAASGDEIKCAHVVVPRFESKFHFISMCLV